jgi:hypothetical protein
MRLCVGQCFAAPREITHRRGYGAAAWGRQPLLLGKRFFFAILRWWSWLSGTRGGRLS